MRGRGLELLAEPDHQLPQLTAVRVPDGVDGKAVAGRLLREHGIEIGGGLAGAPPMWRIGLMGVNASRDVAGRVLSALDAVLAEEPAFVASAYERRTWEGDHRRRRVPTANRRQIAMGRRDLSAEVRGATNRLKIRNPLPGYAGSHRDRRGKAAQRYRFPGRP